MGGFQKPKYGDAVIPMKTESTSLNVLLGKWPIEENTLTFEPFNHEIVDFLADLSNALFMDPEIKQFPDLAAFAFFIRKNNLIRLSELHSISEYRRGRGFVFHIAPSNIPLNFAYSLTFSLLAGNSNIVRLPSRDYYQVGAVCTALRELMFNPKYAHISRSIILIRYGHDTEITQLISEICAVRIVWGGDETIKRIREIPLPISAIDIGFVNKYSSALVSAEQVLNSKESVVGKLALNFFKDSFLFDQHGCSSPKLLIWFGQDDHIRDAKKIFWAKVQSIAESEYDLQQIHSVDKFVSVSLLAANHPEVVLVKVSNFLYRLEVATDSPLIGRFQGTNGIFLETSVKFLEDTVDLLGSNFQTLTYFGFTKDELKSIISNLKNEGLDRIVPIGQAFNMETIWDGMDLIRTLSRVIDLK